MAGSAKKSPSSSGTRRKSNSGTKSKSTGGGKSSSKTGGGGNEIQQSKSPAEFFAENQSIAGFDNPGKSLYTTLRELIENSLDACESVGVLPDVSVTVEEMTESMFNEMRGVPEGDNVAKIGKKKETGGKKNDDGDDNADPSKGSADATTTPTTKTTPKGKGKKDSKKPRAGGDQYFSVSVRDNGCGMAHHAVPDLLGRVLSGSKYGVRQTRGKFGLGAKMALIWSKKSAGVPIRIKTSHLEVKKVGGSVYEEGGERKVGKQVTKCVLDIDIYKNQPRIIEHDLLENTENWIGTEIKVLVSGNWTTYKSRIVQYLQQLAVITPYAKLGMTYTNRSDEKKGMNLRYNRRSEQMPAPAREVKHHPSSVNNIIVQQLLERSKAKSLLKFLSSDLSGISPSVSKRIVERLGSAFDGEAAPDELDNKRVTRLVQMLRGGASDLFKNPDGGCLSPLGEYNLNLGIQKVIEPDIIATARDKAGAYDGHPFIVEAAVSLGGKGAKEGITVVRFANRIPLLFEGGADVSTRVAQSKIKWATYKIDHKRDKIGVFVSIVSTKVPFKGTGKEYIGDDIIEIQQSVKRALQMCCQQLKAHLVKRNALRDVKERRSRLLKYVPDVSRSLFGLLDAARKRKAEVEDGTAPPASPRKRRAVTITNPADRLKASDADVSFIMDRVEGGDLTESVLKECLLEAVERNATAAIQNDEDDGLGPDGGLRTADGSLVTGPSAVRQPLFLVPIYHDPKGVSNVIRHPLFDFHPLKSLTVLPSLLDLD